jgi:Zn-dependent peptidase ImmA (M78 family)
MSDDTMEIEANAFAMELLMPEFLLRPLMPKDGIDLDDEKRIAALAKKFRVSVPAMIVRLHELYLEPAPLPPPPPGAREGE